MPLLLQNAVALLMAGAALAPASADAAVSYLYAFPCAGSSTIGMYPYAPIACDMAGDCYGTALDGGVNAAGTLFQFNFSKNKPTLLQPFGTRDKYNNLFGLSRPEGPLYLGVSKTGQANALYGVVLFDTGVNGSICKANKNDGGCGAVYMVPLATPHKRVLVHQFAGGKDAAHPSAGLVADPMAAGYLAGVTSNGGNGTATVQGDGTAFEAPSARGQTYRLLHVFNKGICRNPYGTPAFDAEGDLVVACASHVVELTRAAGISADWPETALYKFVSPRFPTAGPFIDTNGKIPKQPAGSIYVPWQINTSSCGNTDSCVSGGMLQLTPPAKGQTAWAAHQIFTISADFGNGTNNFPTAFYAPAATPAILANGDLVFPVGSLVQTAKMPPTYPYGAMFRLHSSGATTWTSTVDYILTGVKDGSYAVGSVSPLIPSPAPNSEMTNGQILATVPGPNAAQTSCGGLFDYTPK